MKLLKHPESEKKVTLINIKTLFYEMLTKECIHIVRVTTYQGPISVLFENVN